MIAVAVWLLFAAGCWWVWITSDPQRPAGRAAATASSGDGARMPQLRTPQARTPQRQPSLPRRARRRGADSPPLDEDDVIAFGLALEGTDDVVGFAIADSSAGPAAPRVRRDVAGPF